MISRWSLCDSTVPQVPRTLLSILADLINAVVLMVSTRLHKVIQSLYQFYGDCTMSTTYNFYHLHFHVPLFFQPPSKFQVHIFLFAFFQFYLEVSRERKVYNSANSLLFLLFITKSIRLAEITWPFLSQNHRSVFAFHSLGQILSWNYTICSYGQI